MFVRTAFAILLGSALVQIPDAGQRFSTPCNASISPQRFVANVCSAPTVPNMVDVGRAQAEQTRSQRDHIIRQIAIYESLENQIGLSIAIARLREQGVSSESIVDAAIWEKIHEPSAVASSYGRAPERPGLGWDASH